MRFDAILCFDLIGAGGLARRLGRDLGIPVAGWATGGDMRVARESGHGRLLRQVLRNFHIIFYQSQELRERAAFYLSVRPEELASDRHVVLSRGVLKPPPLDMEKVRRRVRATWGISSSQILALFLGRILRSKGVLDLIHAMTTASVIDPRLVCVMVGSSPGFDDSELVKRQINSQPVLKDRIQLHMACDPESVSEYLCAADIFAFPSHAEGMPNSLLEALAMGIPAVAFAIPPIREIDSGSGCLYLTPPGDSWGFSQAILSLAASPSARRSMGERGKARVFARYMMRSNLEKALALLKQVASD